MRKKRHDKRLDAARTMPPLANRAGAGAFDPMESEAMAWLASRPEIRSYVFDKAKQHGLIEFDRETKTWKGVDY